MKKEKTVIFYYNQGSSDYDVGIFRAVQNSSNDLERKEAGSISVTPRLKVKSQEVYILLKITPGNRLVTL